MTEGDKVADEEDDCRHGPGTVDQLKQISPQTQALSVARRISRSLEIIYSALPLTYSSPPSFPPERQKRYQQAPPIEASRSLTRYVADFALPGQQSELFLAVIMIFRPITVYLEVSIHLRFKT